jgi:hypothetical protein
MARGPRAMRHRLDSAQVQLNERWRMERASLLCGHIDGRTRTLHTIAGDGFLMSQLVQWINNLETNGWAFFADARASTLEIASRLGRPVPSWRGGDEVQLLRPRPRDSAPPNSLSSLHGLAEFPLHTDAAHHPVPPRYVVMRLAQGNITRCATLVVPFSSIAFDQSALASLRRDVWIVNGGRGKFTTTILDSLSISGREIVRYDAACMRPMSRSFARSSWLLQENLGSAPRIRIQWQPTYFLVVDNWRVLHGREAAIGNEQRVLERVLSG